MAMFVQRNDPLALLIVEYDEAALLVVDFIRENPILPIVYDHPPHGYLVWPMLLNEVVNFALKNKSQRFSGAQRRAGDPRGGQGDQAATRRERGRRTTRRQHEGQDLRGA